MTAETIWTPANPEELVEAVESYFEAAAKTSRLRREMDEGMDAFLSPETRQAPDNHLSALSCAYQDATERGDWRLAKALALYGRDFSVVLEVQARIDTDEDTDREGVEEIMRNASRVVGLWKGRFEVAERQAGGES